MAGRQVQRGSKAALRLPKEYPQAQQYSVHKAKRQVSLRLTISAVVPSVRGYSRAGVGQRRKEAGDDVTREDPISSMILY